jgi:cell division protein FtsB
MKKNPTQKLSPLQQNILVRAGAVLVFLGLAWFLFAPGSGLVSLLGEKGELEKMTAETKELSRQNASLKEEINKLQNDAAYLEEVARRDYGLLKSHERVYDFSKGDTSQE